MNFGRVETRRFVEVGEAIQEGGLLLVFKLRYLDQAQLFLDAIALQLDQIFPGQIGDLRLLYQVLIGPLVVEMLDGLDFQLGEIEQLLRPVAVLGVQVDLEVVEVNLV